MTSLEKLPQYIKKYIEPDKNTGFYRFLELINEYLEDAISCLKIENLTKGAKEVLKIDDVFIMESIANLLGVKTYFINKSNKQEYIEFLRAAIQGVVANRSFKGTPESLKETLVKLFTNGSIIPKIKIEDSGNMNLKVIVSGISTNLPEYVIREYYLPKALGVNSNIVILANDVFCYDLDFNEAKYYYEHQSEFNGFLLNNEEVKQAIINEYMSGRQDLILDVFNENNITPENYVKACRQIAIDESKFGANTPNLIEYWLDPEQNSDIGIVKLRTYYGFTSEDNGSAYVLGE